MSAGLAVIGGTWVIVIVLILAIFADITAEDRAERDIREHEEFMAALRTAEPTEQDGAA